MATQKGYGRLARLFVKFCLALQLEPVCEFEQLSAWSFWYATHYTHRTLWGHFSAFRWWCTTTGRVYPAKGSLCQLRMACVMRALRLRDPSVVLPCTPLVASWLRRMQRRSGIADLQAFWHCDLALLSFWVRILCGHAAMLRLCEHEDGMSVTDVTRMRRGDGAEYFVMRVGAIDDGILPKDATNRKIKFRPLRRCVLPISDSPMSAGAVLGVWMARAHPGPCATAKKRVLFSAVQGGIVMARPLSAAAFLRRLRDSLTAVGMPPKLVKMTHCRSLRAGGCTDYFAAGESRERICLQGGWSLRSGSVDVYNRPTTGSRVLNMQQYVHLIIGSFAAPIAASDA